MDDNIRLYFKEQLNIWLANTVIFACFPVLVVMFASIQNIHEYIFIPLIFAFLCHSCLNIFCGKQFYLVIQLFSIPAVVCMALSYNLQDNQDNLYTISWVFFSLTGLLQLIFMPLYIAGNRPLTQAEKQFLETDRLIVKINKEQELRDMQEMKPVTA